MARFVLSLRIDCKPSLKVGLLPRKIFSMSQPLSRIPSGFRYYSSHEARARRVVETTAMSIFAGWSYEEIVTPTVDYYPLFEQGMGESEAQRSFRLTDGDGRLLALRPDVTASIACGRDALCQPHS